MYKKLPYYLAYPVMFINDDETKEQRDYEYMKSMYPATAKRILPYIEKACDRLEYSCSMMYDEYPDRIQLDLMIKQIYDKVKDEENNSGNWLKELIQVMLYQELCKRRNEYRRNRRTYF